MSTHANTDQETVERFSRRSLWVALIIMLLLGAFAFATLAGTGVPGWTGGLVAIAISAAVVALGKMPGSPKAQRALQQDELHRQSVALAQRDALIAVLVAQPLYAYATTQVPSSSSAAPLMACATVTLGSVVLIASLLLRDR